MRLFAAKGSQLAVNIVILRRLHLRRAVKQGDVVYPRGGLIRSGSEIGVLLADGVEEVHLGEADAAEQLCAISLEPLALKAHFERISIKGKTGKAGVAHVPEEGVHCIQRLVDGQKFLFQRDDCPIFLFHFNFLVPGDGSGFQARSLQVQLGEPVSVHNAPACVNRLGEQGGSVIAIIEERRYGVDSVQGSGRLDLVYQVLRTVGIAEDILEADLEQRLVEGIEPQSVKRKLREELADGFLPEGLGGTDIQDGILQVRIVLFGQLLTLLKRQPQTGLGPGEGEREQKQ